MTKKKGEDAPVVADEVTAGAEQENYWARRKSDTEDKRNIYQRLHAAMTDCTYIQKQIGGAPYPTTNHDKVTAKVRQYLMREGVIYISNVVEYTQSGNRTEVITETAFINIDEPDDRFTVRSFGYGCDTGDKGAGKAFSYSVKFALLKTMALETGLDSDNEEIEYEAQETPAKLSAGGVALEEVAGHKADVSKFCETRGLVPLEVGAAILKHFGKRMDDMNEAELDNVHNFLNEHYHREATE